VRLRLLLAAVLGGLLVASPAHAYVNAQHAGLQVALRALGLYPGRIDGLVGPQTVAAIRAAQQRARLPVTGLADDRTRKSLGPLGNPLFGDRVIRPRSFGYDVSVLQFILTQKGVYDGPLDGYLGAGTRAALRRYQQRARLAPDGIVGPRTLSSLVLESRVVVRAKPLASERVVVVYVVKPGDSFTAIAARFHVSIAKLARLNHLDPARVLLIGKRLRVPGSISSGPSTSSALEASPTEVRERLDYWSGHLSVSSQLVRALAWMESGYQPNVVSEVGARGVLQTLPTTRDYVEEVLLGRALPHTLDGDIETGVVYLRHLLESFGGDEQLALAAWYQGEAAVRRHGPYEMTKTFVDDVLALKTRM
jgi:peptidoglycan hydrolase-like protein with peptidoglycan-binding domain